jgi:hypothetical protein
MYFVNMESRKILPVQAGKEAEGHFQIQATDKEIRQLQELFHENDQADWKTYGPAHVPFLEYHHDPQNDEYDNTMRHIFRMLYQLGNEEAKNHIGKMGILKSDDSINNRERRPY